MGTKELAASRQRWSRIARLEELYLPRNNVGDSGGRHLAAALLRNDTVKTLSLSSNNVSTDGASHLPVALGHNSTLAKLDLSYNDLGATGLIT